MDVYIAGLDVKLEVDRACLREMKIPFVIAAPTVKGFPPLGRAEHVYIYIPSALEPYVFLRVGKKPGFAQKSWFPSPTP